MEKALSDPLFLRIDKEMRKLGYVWRETAWHPVLTPGGRQLVIAIVTAAEPRITIVRCRPKTELGHEPLNQ